MEAGIEHVCRLFVGPPEPPYSRRRAVTKAPDGVDVLAILLAGVGKAEILTMDLFLSAHRTLRTSCYTALRTGECARWGAEIGLIPSQRV